MTKTIHVGQAITWQEPGSADAETFTGRVVAVFEGGVGVIDGEGKNRYVFPGWIADRPK